MAVPNSSDQLSVGGVRFRPSNFDHLRAAVHQVATAADPPTLAIGFINPHVVTTAATSPVVARYLDRCDHVCVDGVGVWLAALGRGRRTERMPAHNVFDRLLANGDLTGTLLVIGIEPDRVQVAADAIVAKSPTLQLVGCIDGFASNAQLAKAIDRLQPVDVVIIGAGSPRSEEIAELVMDRCVPRVVFHAGAGTLKVHAGDRVHPPAVFGRLGLDWVYRLLFEPHTRRRYLLGLPAFALQVFQPPRSLFQGRS